MILSSNVECALYVIGKPVYIKYTDQNYGSWMRDVGKSESAEKIWATRENDAFQLYEYASRMTYKNNIPSKVYRMQFPFKV